MTKHEIAAQARASRYGDGNDGVVDAVTRRPGDAEHNMSMTQQQRQDIAQFNEDFNAKAEKVGKCVQTGAEIGASALAEPVDWAMSFKALLDNPTSGAAWGGALASLLPMVPSKVVREGLQHGDEAVDAAKKALGKADDPTINGYKLKEKLDLDWRGTGKSHIDALDEAFKRTGFDRSEFTVTQFAKDGHGKSQPVEWYHKASKSEVNMDIGHKGANTPGSPHVGYQTGKPKTVGHIFVDSVPANRSKKP